MKLSSSALLFTVWAFVAGCAGDGADTGPKQVPAETADCRAAVAACAPGFLCVDSDGTWTCVLGDSENPERDGSIGAEHPSDDPPVVAAGEPSEGQDDFDAQAPSEHEPPNEPAPTSGDGEDGAACAGDADCSSGYCAIDDGTVPGGLCTAACSDNKECSVGAVCVDLAGDGDSLCLAACAGTGDCRSGWTCLDVGGPSVCLPRCEYYDCGAGYYCEPSTGVCAAEGETPPALPQNVTIILEQVLIRPYIVADGTNWDGLGSASQGVVDSVTTALLGASPYAQVLSILVDQLNANTAAPDSFGTATLFVDGSPSEQALPLIDDEYVPVFGVSWESVPFSEAQDVRLRVSLTDQDVSDNDQIGVATVSHDDLLSALAAGDTYPANVSEQGNGQILFITVQVIPSN